MTNHDAPDSACRTPVVRTGQVFLIWCPWARPEPKHKFYVLVQIEPRTLYFVISSEVPPFILANPEMARHQIRLPFASHKEFLSYDSYLGCHETFGGPTASELEDGLADGSIKLLGEVDFLEHRQAREVIESSELLLGKEIRGILEQW